MYTLLNTSERIELMRVVAMRYLVDNISIDYRFLCDDGRGHVNVYICIHNTHIVINKRQREHLSYRIYDCNTYVTAMRLN